MELHRRSYRGVTLALAFGATQSSPTSIRVAHAASVTEEFCPVGVTHITTQKGGCRHVISFPEHKASRLQRFLLLSLSGRRGSVSNEPYKLELTSLSLEGVPHLPTSTSIDSGGRLSYSDHPSSHNVPSAHVPAGNRHARAYQELEVTGFEHVPAPPIERESSQNTRSAHTKCSFSERADVKFDRVELRQSTSEDASCVSLNIQPTEDSQGPQDDDAAWNDSERITRSPTLPSPDAQLFGSPIYTNPGVENKGDVAAGRPACVRPAPPPPPPPPPAIVTIPSPLFAPYSLPMPRRSG